MTSQPPPDPYKYEIVDNDDHNGYTFQSALEHLDKLTLNPGDHIKINIHNPKTITNSSFNDFANTISTSTKGYNKWITSVTIHMPIFFNGIGPTPQTIAQEFLGKIPNLRRLVLVGCCCGDSIAAAEAAGPNFNSRQNGYDIGAKTTLLAGVVGPLQVLCVRTNLIRYNSQEIVPLANLLSSKENFKGLVAFQLSDRGCLPMQQGFDDKINPFLQNLTSREGLPNLRELHLAVPGMPVPGLQQQHYYAKLFSTTTKLVELSINHNVFAELVFPSDLEINNTLKRLNIMEFRLKGGVRGEVPGGGAEATRLIEFVCTSPSLEVLIVRTLGSFELHDQEADDDWILR